MPDRPVKLPNGTRYVGNQTRFALIMNERTDSYAIEVIYLSRAEYDKVKRFVTRVLRKQVRAGKGAKLNA